MFQSSETMYMHEVTDNWSIKLVRVSKRIDPVLRNTSKAERFLIISQFYSLVCKGTTHAINTKVNNSQPFLGTLFIFQNHNPQNYRRLCLQTGRYFKLLSTLPNLFRLAFTVPPHSQCPPCPERPGLV